MEVRQRRERGCRVFLSCENQIFLKLPQQWLAEKAATAMTGQGHVCTHNLIHHRAPDTISINLSSACPPPPKKKGKKTIFLFNHLWLNQAYNPLTNGEDQRTPAGSEIFSHEHKHKVEHVRSCLFSYVSAPVHKMVEDIFRILNPPDCHPMRWGMFLHHTWREHKHTACVDRLKCKYRYHRDINLQCVWQWHTIEFSVLL